MKCKIEFDDFKFEFSNGQIIISCFSLLEYVDSSAGIQLHLNVVENFLSEFLEFVKKPTPLFEFCEIQAKPISDNSILITDEAIREQSEPVAGIKLHVDQLTFFINQLAKFYKKCLSKNNVDC